MLDFIVNIVFGFFFACILGRTLLSYIVPMSGSSVLLLASSVEYNW